jgi:ribosomal protein L37AE/L43A
MGTVESNFKCSVCKRKTIHHGIEHHDSIYWSCSKCGWGSSEIVEDKQTLKNVSILFYGKLLMVLLIL